MRGWQHSPKGHRAACSPLAAGCLLLRGSQSTVATHANRLRCEVLLVVRWVQVQNTTSMLAQYHHGFLNNTRLHPDGIPKVNRTEFVHGNFGEPWGFTQLDACPDKCNERGVRRLGLAAESERAGSAAAYGLHCTAAKLKQGD